MSRKQFFILATMFLALSNAQAQDRCPAYWTDVQQFKKKDSAGNQPANAILLIGSSSFTRWTDVQEYFPGYRIINRGFGGSQLTDQVRYFYDVVFPYAPKQVVIYCGENDLASENKPGAAEVVQRFKTLFGMIRQNFPQANIQFVSLKPSPSRQALLGEFQKTNKAISAFLKTQRNAGFIDIYTAMLDANGQPRKDLFVEDNLHMNAAGYRIWQKIFLPHLKK